MSELKITKADGSTTQFNFKFDNGLPVKPIINPAYQEMYSKSENLHMLYIYLEQTELDTLGDININGYLSELKNGVGEIWLFIKDVYLVLENLNAKIIEELDNKRLGFCFFTKDKNFIKGIQLE